MQKPNSVLAIVPARGGSKTIPRKNLVLCAGKPLLQWTYDALKDAHSVTRGVLSSEDSEILATCPAWMTALRRPSALATDTASTEGVIKDVLETIHAEIVVLLQPTSPIRTGQQIDEAITLLVDEEYDSVVSVSPCHTFIWQENKHGARANYDWKHRPRRQDLVRFEENGSIYVFTRGLWERQHNRLGGHIGLYKMGEAEGYQVDTPLDLFIVEQILLKRQGEALVG